MTTQEFGELAGRIEGIARAVMILSGTLHRQELIDQQRLQANLRSHADALEPSVQNRTTVVQTLEQIADQLLADYQYLEKGACRISQLQMCGS